MHQPSLRCLEYDLIKSRLSELAASARAKRRVEALQPETQLETIDRLQGETTDARRLMDIGGAPPLALMDGIDRLLPQFNKGQPFTPDELTEAASFLTTCRRMRQYLLRLSTHSHLLSGYAGTINPLEDIEKEIERCIRAGQVEDRASPELTHLRQGIERAGESIKRKLESLLRGHPEWFMESFVVQRNGRWTLPVRREQRGNVPGSIVDASQSGVTVFVEPSSVRALQEELDLLRIQEDNEVRRILYTLTAMLEEQEAVLRLNCDTMEALDVVFARGRLSADMGAAPANVSRTACIRLRGARHPLLDPKVAVPLDVDLGGRTRSLVITGPNTGGKTVALKTVGLLTLMAQSGLHVPCAPESEFRLCQQVLCDIGDGQSIAQNLSTFSSHMVNIRDLLALSARGTLVLLDELGAGTDPAEGMGLATALLEAFFETGCLMIATTHYPEIKEFAQRTRGFENARMAFDVSTLQPLYRLEIGHAGKSCALLIAKRLGMPQRVLQRAQQVTYGQTADDSSLILDVLGEDLAEKSPDAAEKTQTVPGAELIDDGAEQGKAQITSPSAADKPSGPQYAPGDSVYIPSLKRHAIVAEAPDARGQVTLILSGKRMKMQVKRIKPHLGGEELYPGADYDLSIVLDTVENRKARHRMDKGKVGQIVVVKPGRE